MTREQRAPTSTDTNCVRKVVNVQAPQDVAWRVFTEKMGTWWPLAIYKIGKANAVDAVVEPRVGGRWYERGDDGSTCDWGSVALWEPHSRLVLYWEITADWQHDPSYASSLRARALRASSSSIAVSIFTGRVATRCVASLTRKAIGAAFSSSSLGLPAVLLRPKPRNRYGEYHRGS